MTQGTLFISALCALSVCSYCRAGDTMDPQSVRALAKEAYIFTYPLVMNYRTMFMQAIDGDKAMGKWLHLGLSSPADTDIVTPNNDTPYSYA